MRVFYGHQRNINGEAFLVKTERGLSWFSRLSAVKKQKKKRNVASSDELRG